ncbi:MAG TPA: hypothetical protein DCQ31_16310 [Bacteroidales bacterium]|nr:hypothetical protein [Bacteroidales bacterium]
MQFLDTKHSRYKELKLKTDNLGGLVEQLQIIALNDSLLKLAAMPENSRLSVIDQLIEKVKRAEEEAKNPNNRQTQYMQDEFDRNKGGQSGSTFYFYNQASVSIGTAEFKKKWGARRLEDDWRRKNKAIVEFDDNADSEGEDENSADKITDNKSREFYLQDIPLTDSLRVIVIANIEKAYLKAAEIYKLNLTDYNASAKVYEEFIAKFPKNGFLSAVYYDLYLIYAEIKNTEKSEFYKKKLINEYPESNYAKLFTNPEYIKEIARKEAEAERFYEQVYQAFQLKNFNRVIADAAIANANFPNHKLLPKFNFLKVMSLGALNGQEVFATELQQYIAEVKHPELKKRAEEMLAVLVSSNAVVSEKIIEKEIEIYDTNLNFVHIFGLIVYATEINTEELKFRLLGFNLDNYTNENYLVEVLSLDENTKLFLVKTFVDKAMARDYFTKIQSNTEVFKNLKPDTYKLMYISLPNFGVLTTDKSTEKYLQFFKKNYN